MKIKKAEFLFPIEAYTKLKEKLGEPKYKMKYDILGNYTDLIERNEEFPSELVEKINLKEGGVMSMEDFTYHLS